MRRGKLRDSSKVTQVLSDKTGIQSQAMSYTGFPALTLESGRERLSSEKAGRGRIQGAGEG